MGFLRWVRRSDAVAYQWQNIADEAHHIRTTCHRIHLHHQQQQQQQQQQSQLAMNRDGANP